MKTMSRNQKEIRLENFKKLRWKYEDGKLKAETEIRRKPFGEFKATFRMSTQNEETVLEVENYDFPILNRTACGFESFEKAVEALKRYFDEIDELTKKIPQNAKDEATKDFTPITEKELKEVYGVRDPKATIAGLEKCFGLPFTEWDKETTEAARDWLESKKKSRAQLEDSEYPFPVGD